MAAKKKEKELEIAPFANRANNIYLQKLEEHEYQMAKKRRQKREYQKAATFIVLLAFSIFIVGFIEGRF